MHLARPIRRRNCIGGFMGWAIVIIVGIILLVVLGAGLWVMGAYNRLVNLKERVRAGWSQIEVLLKRRHDLIPNLVESVRGYAAHESGTLESVIAARNQAVAAKGVQQQAQAEGMLTQALGRLFAVAEAYPELRANQNFMQLQNELTETENGIAGQRQAYNNIVTTYNTSIQQFPTNLIAGPFGFQASPFFEVTSTGEREAPKVQF
jgi:LemA protein